MTTTLLSLAWIALCFAFAALFVVIDLDLNFFNWVGKWRSQSFVCIAGIMLLLVATYFLAFAAQKKPISIVAGISCLLLVGFGLSMVLPEKVGDPRWWLHRATASPHWYRWGRLAIACIPLCILASVSISYSRRRTGRNTDNHSPHQEA